MSITVTRVRHNWPEAAGFTISRPKGIDSYTFLYFHNPVEEALSQAGLEADRLYVFQNGHFITDLVRKIELEHFSKPALYQLMQELSFRKNA